METNRLAGQHCDTAIWLGAGVLTLGIGAAALIGGTGLAHADSPDASGPAKAPVGSSAPHSGAKTTGHRAPYKAPGIVRVSAPPSVSAAQKPSMTQTVASARVAKTPLQVFCDGSVRLLVALAGMNPTTPTPAPGNLWQLGLYSAARWLADTANPAGIPKVQVVSTGDPNVLTGVVTGRVVFTDAAGAPLTYQVTTDPKLGTVAINSDGGFTFTPRQSTILGAPDGGLTIKMKVTAINGVQRATQTVTVAVGNPWSLVKQTIAVGSGPLGIAVSSGGTRLVVSNSGDGTVSVIDTSTNKVITTLPVGTAPAGVVSDPTAPRVYVVNGSGTVSVVSLTNNTVGGQPITVGTNPLLAAIGPAGSPAAGKLYVTNYASGSGNTVSVIDTTTNQVVTTLTVAASGAGSQAITINPDGTRLWVGNTQAGTVSVVNTTTNAVVKTLPVSGGTGFIGFSPNGHFAYIANFTANTVSVINTSNYSTAATIPVGKYPSGIAVSPDGSVAYVTNQQDNTVSVINTATKTVIKTITVGNTPLGVAVSPDGNYLYVANLLGASITVIPV